VTSALTPTTLTCDAASIEALVKSEVPVLLKGFVSHWPMVKMAQEQGAKAVLDDLIRRYNGHPVLAFHSEHAAARFFYDDSGTRYNFTKQKADLAEVLASLQAGRQDTYYVGSTATDRCLDGFDEEHTLPMGARQPVQSLWIGNRSTVPAHFDVPSNIACCALGRRRFTLFPPDQIENLYIHQMDLTPAGQTVSAVDIARPDYQRFPRYRQAEQVAWVAELEPGDAMFVPSMWWHNVEALDEVNALVNFWWREEPAYLGPPAAVLNHALLSIRHLPRAQREAWRAHFEYYVFGEADLSHIPAQALGKLGDMDERLARQLRAELQNQLK
jgi:hypothetical protein